MKDSFGNRLINVVRKRKYTIAFIWAAIICSMLNDHSMYEFELIRQNIEYIFEYIYQIFVVMAMIAFLYEHYIYDKYEDSPRTPILQANIINAFLSVALIQGLTFLYNHERWGIGIYAFLLPVLVFVYGLAAMLEFVYLGYNSKKSGKAFVIRLMICIVCAIVGILATAIIYFVFTEVVSRYTEVGILNDWVIRIGLLGIVLPGFIIGVEWDN